MSTPNTQIPAVEEHLPCCIYNWDPSVPVGSCTRCGRHIFIDDLYAADRAYPHCPPEGASLMICPTCINTLDLDGILRICGIIYPSELVVMAGAMRRAVPRLGSACVIRRQ